MTDIKCMHECECTDVFECLYTFKYTKRKRLNSWAVMKMPKCVTQQWRKLVGWGRGGKGWLVEGYLLERVTETFQNKT